MNASEQLKALRYELRLTQSELSKGLDVSLSAIANIENGSREISKSMMKLLFDKYNVSASWLLTGEGEMFRTQEKKEISVTEDRTIPILNQSVSLGPGQEWQEADISDGFLDSLTLLANIRAKDCYAFRVRGTSMVGLGIDDGDMVILNRDMQDLNDDIYVFALDGSVYCKLLKFDSITKKIRIYSVHTKELKDAELLKVIDTTNPDINEYFHIFGRVLGWVRENTLMRR